MTEAWYRYLRHGDCLLGRVTLAGRRGSRSLFSSTLLRRPPPTPFLLIGDKPIMNLEKYVIDSDCSEPN